MITAAEAAVMSGGDALKELQDDIKKAIIETAGRGGYSLHFETDHYPFVARIAKKTFVDLGFWVRVDELKNWQNTAKTRSVFQISWDIE